MSQTITSSTAVMNRRFSDKGGLNCRGRTLSCNPGSGSVFIKHKIGTSYVTMFEVNENSTDKALILESFDVHIEIECTGDAVAQISNPN